MWFLSHNLVGKNAPGILGESWFNTDSLPDRAKKSLTTKRELFLDDLAPAITLIHFWDYACSHCLATLPHISSLWKQYRSSHFFVVGVHTPQFAFGKDNDKVESALLRFNISYPVANDSQYETWKRYKNKAWPRTLICDRGGIVRYDYEGEGEYDEQAAFIKKLLITAN